MDTFKSLCSLNFGKLSFGMFQFKTRNELFDKDDFDIELQKKRRELVKELQDDVITERAKTINEAVKEIEKLLVSNISHTEIEKLEKIKAQLANISNCLFSDPEETIAI